MSFTVLNFRNERLSGNTTMETNNGSLLSGCWKL